MTTETNPSIYDVLVTDGQPNGKLTKVGTAYPTPKGTGLRCTLKANLAEGAQLVILPGYRRLAAAETPAASEGSA